MTLSKWLKVFGVLCIGGCIGLSIVFSILVISSWFSGIDGQVLLTFNKYHERWAETIIFPIWTICGLIMSIYLIRNTFKEKNG